MQDGTNVYKDMDRLVAFEKGLTTWAQWVDSSMQQAETKVFFQGISPTHYKLDFSHKLYYAYLYINLGFSL